MSFQPCQNDSLMYYRSTLLSEVRHGFSTRQGGVSLPPWDSLNLGISRGDDPKAVEENYQRLFRAIGLDPRRSVLSKQVHEATVRVVTEQDAGKGLYLPRDYTADALITDVPHLPLVVFSADCNILLLYDPVRQCVGAVHSGWRGTALGTAAKAVEEMRRVFGCQPEHLRCAIGPGIDPCCFETHDDVPTAMRQALGTEAEPYLHPRGEKWQVDLKGLNALWLRRSGVTQVDLCPLCTGCHTELFWSHRKMGNARGSQIAVIAAGGAE